MRKRRTKLEKAYLRVVQRMRQVIRDHYHNAMESNDSIVRLANAVGAMSPLVEQYSEDERVRQEIERRGHEDII